MRIDRLSVTGFGPFKNTQVIDFRSFDDDGLFLITGRTGAGKSSILDAICFALYGSVPRYEGAEQRLRSDHAEADAPTLVELEFSVDDGEYRVTRSPQFERRKKSGTGTTLQKASAELFEKVGDDWQGIAAKPNEVGPEILRVVGLTREQFLQVILLAQNRFQEFLLAKNDDRQRVLRNLFGTRRFEQIEQAIVERRKALDVRIGSMKESLALDAGRASSLLGALPPEHPDIDWFENGYLGLAAQRDDAEVQARHADDAVAHADRALRELETTLGLQVRRDRATARLAALAEEAADVDAARSNLDAARRAAVVSPSITAVVAAETELGSARTRETAARTAFEARRPGSSSSDDAGLRALIAETTRTMGGLDEILHDERTIPSLEAEVETLTRRLSRRRDAVRGADDRAGALPAELDAIGARLRQLQAIADTEGTVADELGRLEAAQAAAVSAARLTVERDEARGAEVAAVGAASAAGARFFDLLERRLAGHAAELAGGLIDGVPCRVCGSPEHPHPAVGDGKPITQADVDAARAAEGRERDALDRASAITADLDRRLGDARARAGDETVDVLAARLAAARIRSDDAAAAARDALAARAHEDRLKDEAADLTARLVGLRAEAEDAAAALLTARSRHEEVMQRVLQSRGDHPSVAQRAGDLVALLDTANALLDAVAATSSCREQAEAAASALDRQLADQGFASAPDALSASRTRGDITAAERRIRDHDADVAAAASALADLDPGLLPDRLVEVEPAEAHLRSAHGTRDAALSAAASLQSRVEQLNGIVQAARTTLASSRRLHDEHRQLSELANAVEGREPNDKRMRLETYVLAARLEEIVEAANSRLRTMTGGRFALEHDDAVQYRGAQSGLGLLIRDEHIGRARPTHSLSGGETFLASLALALGLAEVVTNQAGGIRLDTLFVDEGFGSLDGETLAIAMGTLDGLRAGGRTIGLISHVDAMKEQIPAKLHISVTAGGWSEISPAYELA